jgi:hypothetical protein
MEWALIIVVLLYVLAAVVAFKLLKSVVKALLWVGAVGVILVVILSFFVYKDVVDLRDNWPGSQKLLLAEKDGKLVAGLVSSFSNNEEPVFVTAEQLVSLQSSFGVKDYKSMIGDNYKLLVMDVDSVLAEVKAEQFSFGEMNVSRGDVVSILESDDAFVVLVDKLMVDKSSDSKTRAQVEAEVMKSAGSQEKVKAMAFAVLVAQLFSEKGSGAGLFVLKEFKSGKLIIYPETSVFKTIKFVPGFVIDSAGKIVEKRMKGVVGNGNS